MTDKKLTIRQSNRPQVTQKCETKLLKTLNLSQKSYVRIDHVCVHIIVHAVVHDTAQNPNSYPPSMSTGQKAFEA